MDCQILRGGSLIIKGKPLRTDLPSVLGVKIAGATQFLLGTLFLHVQERNKILFGQFSPAIVALQSAIHSAPILWNHFQSSLVLWKGQTTKIRTPPPLGQLLSVKTAEPDLEEKYSYIHQHTDGTEHHYVLKIY